MYAAAGGASLASRQARRKQKQHHTSENIHTQFNKRFHQLQHQHAPACAEGYHYMRTSSSGFLSPSHLPSCTDLHSRGGPIDYSLHEQLLEIHDTPLGVASSEDLRGGLHRQYDAAANMLLYVGLCAVALGLVIAFVGTGEKGFKTLNRQAYLASDKAHLEYYKHLPFRTQNFLLFEQAQQQQTALLKENKKRVSIATRPHERRIGNDKVPDFIIDDAASDTLSTLRELSPLHEEDLIDFQQSSNSFENLPSLDSSLEYLNERSNEEPAGNAAANGAQNIGPSQSFITEEQLSRLKSTLTFRDSADFADSRLMISYDEFDLQDELKFGQDKKEDGGLHSNI
ncbi:hypothetical protein U1Q18_048666 [Sarracenia purpurea var. burkii]